MVSRGRQVRCDD